MASSDAEAEVRNRGQQPMLASQRAKDTPSEATRTAGKTGYFPLGYKEGFNQWVCISQPPCTLQLAANRLL